MIKCASLRVTCRPWTSRASRVPLDIQAQRTTREKKPSSNKNVKNENRLDGGLKRPLQRSQAKDDASVPWVRTRLQDGSLLMGDFVMVTATELSSERIPIDDLLVLTSVTVLSWLASAVILGDYKGGFPEGKNWYSYMLGPVYVGVVDATVTWALSIGFALATFSIMVSTGFLEPGPLLDDLTSEDLSPQMEVTVATLVTLCCWRGIAWYIRSNR